MPALRGEGGDAYAVTEAEAGSDPGGIASTAVATGDGWRINGEKWFVTSGDVARVLIVMANVVDGADRLPTLFLIEPDAPGVEFVDDPRFTHNYPHGHPTIRFTDVEVGADAVIGGLGNGETLQRAWFTEERLGIATHGLGAMWRLLEETTAWALERRPGRLRGSWTTRASRSRSPTRRPTPRSAGCSRSHVAGMVDAGADLKLIHAKASMAKLFVSRGRRPLRRPRRADLRRARLHAQLRRRAVPPRAARRPDLGGHERGAAADHRARARASRGRGHDPLAAVMDLDRLLHPAVGRGRRRDRSPRELRGPVAVEPRRDRLRRSVWGVNPGRTRRSGGRACRRSPTYLGRSMPCRRRDPGRGCRRRSSRRPAHAAAAAPSCSAPGSPSSRPGARLQHALVAAARRVPPARVRPQLRRHRRAVRTRRALGRRPAPASRARGAGVPERQRRGQRAALASRAAAAHGGLLGNQAVLERRRLRRVSGARRGRARDRALPRGRRRRRGSAMRWPLRRARGARRRAEGRQLRRRRPRRGRPLAARSPATSASSAR